MRLIQLEIANNSEYELEYVAHDFNHGSFSRFEPPKNIKAKEKSIFTLKSSFFFGVKGFVKYRVKDEHKSVIKLFFIYAPRGAGSSYYRIYPESPSRFYGNFNESIAFRQVEKNVILEGDKVEKKKIRYSGTYTVENPSIPNIFIAFADTHVNEADEGKWSLVEAINSEIIKSGANYLGAIGCGDLYNNDVGSFPNLRTYYEFADIFYQGSLRDEAPTKNSDKQNGLIGPLYEGAGNHDGYEGIKSISNNTAWEKIRIRNLAYEGRRWVDSISENSFHYSWLWKGVRFFQLNLFPGDHKPEDLKRSFNPKNSLTFLKKTLKSKCNENTPIICCFHYGLNKKEINEMFWGSKEITDFGEAIDGYNVVGIFTGHSHHNVNDDPSYIWKYKEKEYNCFHVGCRDGAYLFKLTDDSKVVFIKGISKT